MAAWECPRDEDDPPARDEEGLVSHCEHPASHSEEHSEETPASHSENPALHSDRQESREPLNQEDQQSEVVRQLFSRQGLRRLTAEASKAMEQRPPRDDRERLLADPLLGWPWDDDGDVMDAWVPSMPTEDDGGVLDASVPSMPTGDDDGEMSDFWAASMLAPDGDGETLSFWVASMALSDDD